VEQSEGGQPKAMGGTEAPAAQEEGVGGPNAPPYVFAVGRVQARFPTLGVEKEYAQARSRAETAGLNDQEVLHAVLSERANRYLVRQMCFVLTIEGLDTYLLRPRDPLDFELLVEAVRPAPSPGDQDVVVGIKGPLAPPEACGGMTIPIVAFDQLYSFDVESLIGGIPRPEDLPEDQDERFRSTTEQVYYRLVQVADNAGDTDEHRAINFLTVRYPRIYEETAKAHERNFSLSGVEARPSSLGDIRRRVDVVFTYTDRQTNVEEKQSVVVDVHEPNPFLVKPLSPYFPR
jgi:hypothetical protein